MKDKGLDKGLIQEFNTSDRDKRGWSKGFYGFRKMFWDYLNKLNVPFFDPCCPEASKATRASVGYNLETGEYEYYNSETGQWQTPGAAPTPPAPEDSITTTTTAAPEASTTTTTTVAEESTTTTTTIA